MSNIDDGYIKYDRGDFTLADPLNEEEYSDLEQWRNKLFKLKLIGEYLPERIGYGNLSQRKSYQHLHTTRKSQFCITGTQTGKYEKLSGEYYTRVLDYDFKKMSIKAYGPLEASSEALTHASLYDVNQNICSVFHIHSATIWKGMIEANELCTGSDVPYGTLEMAEAVALIARSHNQGSFVMKGHEDGVVIFGENNEQVGELTIKLFELYHKN